MVCMCILCTFELEAGESGAQGQTHSVIQYKASLGYIGIENIKIERGKIHFLKKIVCHDSRC